MRSAAARIRRLNYGIPGAPRPLLPFSVTLARNVGMLAVGWDVGRQVALLTITVNLVFFGYTPED